MGVPGVGAPGVDGAALGCAAAVRAGEGASPEVLNAVLEALSQGLPVVCLANGGPAAVVGQHSASQPLEGAAADHALDGRAALHQLRQTLRSSAQDLGALGRDNSYGYGLVQAHDACKRIKAMGCGN